jgi:hypothetical protein
MEPEALLPCSQEPSFHNKLFSFYCEELLAPRPTPKLEDELENFMVVKCSRLSWTQIKKER